MRRVGILTSHPIQYQAPWFRALAPVVDLEVFFAHRQSAAEQGKSGFGVAFDWDVDLLAGYKHRFLQNIAPRPGVNHFAGCDTPELEAVVKPFDAFIVNGWYLKSYLQAARACRRAGVPVLVRGDSQLRTPRSALKRLAMEVRQRLLLRNFDGFLTVGQRNREYLEHYGVNPERIFFAPHFVDNVWFGRKAGEAKMQRAETRTKWGIPEDAFCILFCGKFIDKKRPLDLVKAAQRLMSQNAGLPQLHLLFVGSGELGPQLRESCRVVFDAENPGLPLRTSKVDLCPASFVGFKNQSELPLCYSVADALVLPSDGGETWGLVVNEAMACGLPAIVSDAVGCAPDLIADGQTGFTFPLGDVTALSAQVTKLARLHRDRFDFSCALRQKLDIYSVDQAVKGTLDAIAGLGKRMQR